jgi:hypothetical protein
MQCGVLEATKLVEEPQQALKVTLSFSGPQQSEVLNDQNVQLALRGGLAQALALSTSSVTILSLVANGHMRLLTGTSTKVAFKIRPEAEYDGSVQEIWARIFVQKYQFSAYFRASAADLGVLPITQGIQIDNQVLVEQATLYSLPYSYNSSVVPPAPTPPGPPAAAAIPAIPWYDNEIGVTCLFTFLLSAASYGSNWYLRNKATILTRKRGHEKYEKFGDRVATLGPWQWFSGVVMAYSDFVSDCIFAYQRGQDRDLAFYNWSMAFIFIPIIVSAYLWVKYVAQICGKRGPNPKINGKEIQVKEQRHDFVMSNPMVVVQAVVSWTHLELLRLFPWKEPKEEFGGFPSLEIYMMTTATVVFEDVPQFCIQFAFARSKGADAFTVFSLVNTGLSILISLMTKAGLWDDFHDAMRTRAATIGRPRTISSQSQVPDISLRSNPLVVSDKSQLEVQHNPNAHI